jgi:hypothetical protein
MCKKQSRPIWRALDLCNCFWDTQRLSEHKRDCVVDVHDVSTRSEDPLCGSCDTNELSRSNVDCPEEHPPFVRSSQEGSYTVIVGCLVTFRRKELRSCDEVGESGNAVWYTCCAHCWMGWKKCIDNRRQSIREVVQRDSYDITHTESVGSRSIQPPFCTRISPFVCSVINKQGGNKGPPTVSSQASRP